MSGQQKKSGKSKKRKAEDSCSICLGRGRLEQSKTHSDQYCAHPGGPYEGDWKKANLIKNAEEEALRQVLSRQDVRATPTQIYEKLSQIRHRRNVFGQTLSKGPDDIMLRTQA